VTLLNRTIGQPNHKKLNSLINVNFYRNGNGMNSNNRTSKGLDQHNFCVYPYIGIQAGKSEVKNDIFLQFYSENLQTAKNQEDNKLRI